MNGMNRVVLMGHLNYGPISGLAPSGKRITVFHIATNEYIKNEDGDKIKRTDLHKITTHGKTAESCEKMLRQGSMVLVEGKIRSSVNKDSKNSYDILATDVSFIAGYKTKQEVKDENSN